MGHCHLSKVGRQSRRALAIVASVEQCERASNVEALFLCAVYFVENDCQAAIVCTWCRCTSCWGNGIEIPSESKRSLTFLVRSSLAAKKS